MEIRERLLELRLASIEVGESPEQVALGYMNACAEAGGMKPEFMFSYYTGTIGEYDRGAV